jgi:enoyl-CoA hydratase
MNFSNIQIQTGERVMRITINRPASLNALNTKTLEELSLAIDQAAADDEVHVVVITGAGDKAFVAGADIAEIQALDEDSVKEFGYLGHETMLKFENLGKPVIAAVNGYALGGGCELALACTLRIASDNALIGLPEISLGIIPGFGGTQRLPRIVGAGRGFEMMLSGKPITAAKAMEWGLFNHIVAQEQLEETTGKLAAQLAKSAPLAMRGILDAVHQGVDLPLEDGLATEMAEFFEICQTQDMQEGTSAFLEKRKAIFKGR